MYGKYAGDTLAIRWLEVRVRRESSIAILSFSFFSLFALRPLVRKAHPHKKRTVAQCRLFEPVRKAGGLWGKPELETAFSLFRADFSIARFTSSKVCWAPFLYCIEAEEWNRDDHRIIGLCFCFFKLNCKFCFVLMGIPRSSNKRVRAE